MGMFADRSTQTVHRKRKAANFAALWVDLLDALPMFVACEPSTEEKASAHSPRLYETGFLIGWPSLVHGAT